MAACKGPPPPAQGGVVRHGQIEAKQREHAAGETLPLPKSQVEHEPQRQHQLDRQVRVAWLPARGAPPRCVLPRDSRVGRSATRKMAGLVGLRLG